jgi:PPP family 3-phenylpropionic acid transporter
MSFAALAGPAGRATATFYAGIFLALGAHLPFWPVWLKDWGLSDAEVGAMLGAAVFARIAAGVGAPWLADLTGARRTALALLGALGAAVFLAHLLAETRGALLALTLLAAIAMSGSIPIGDALASAAARLHGFGYAQVRAVGSAAFLLANIACGWAIGLFGAQAALWWIVAAMALTAVAALRHPGGARPPGALVERPKLGEALRLARRGPFLLAALASAAAQASHGPLYAYGSLHWRAQGLDEATIGQLWALGVAVEVALMLWLGGWLTARLGAWGCFALSAAAALARWAAMALEPSAAWLWFWQATHALSFAPAHLAAVAFVTAAAPERLAASAQGLIGAGIGGAAMAGAMFAAAAVYPAHGAGIFWLGAGLAALALAAAFALRARWDGGALE